MLLALRVNVLAKGYSGISQATLNRYIEAFNKDILSYIPEKGTVGARRDSVIRRINDSFNKKKFLTNSIAGKGRTRID